MTIVPGPAIIGATGGSGTRVVARIVRQGGMYIGTKLNVSEDALDFGAFSDRWINAFVWPIDDGPPSDVPPEMAAHLETMLSDHLQGLLPTARVWGWKEPRTSFLLPFFHARFPSMKFLHVVRDGRDMAFSANQNQLRNHGATLLSREEASACEPIQSITLWSRHNERVANYGERRLGDRYLRVRFEDFCTNPGDTAGRVFEFLDLAGDCDAIARAEVSVPPSLGRWATEDPGIIASLQQIAGSTLRRFGYR